MSEYAKMINLGYTEEYIFAVPVPAWSTQHELQINSANSWVKYPKPNGVGWIKLPLNENYIILGLSTPAGFVLPDGKKLDKENGIIGTIYRSHIVTNASQFGIEYRDSDAYLVLQMFIK